MSPEWRTLFRFAVEEAARRNMVVGLNLCDGWNAGGPWVKPEDAAKTLACSTLRVTGPKNFSATFPKADKADKTYRDTMVLAWQLGGPGAETRKNACLSQTWLDLTAKMSSEGRLAWEVPKGEWLIARFGYTNGKRRASRTVENTRRSPESPRIHNRVFGSNERRCESNLEAAPGRQTS